MSFQFEPLIPARVGFDAHGTPFSEQYDDIYHARLGALEQAEHVFLRGNGLPERWRGKPSFTVCETGFGLGQNFLALWGAWRADPQRSPRLHVLSFEAHPFSRSDLSQVLMRSVPPDLRGLAEQLAEQWPAALPGVHRLEFEGGALTLTLAFGAVGRLARQVQACADAFFLDGFSPRKNPEMWTPALFGQLVRLAARGATASTWCTAGAVRRALSDAGFLVSKAPGFGSKRDMTVATLRPNLGRQGERSAPSDTVLIVGGGLAAAGIAHALALRGQPAVLVDPVFAAGLGGSHAGHCAAALTPLISRDDDLRARLSRAGALRALHRWLGLAHDARPRRCGTIELALTPRAGEERQEALRSLAFPQEWVRWVDRSQASVLAGVAIPHGGVYFPDGLLVRPGELIGGLLADGLIRCVPASVACLAPQEDGSWKAWGHGGGLLAQARTVVLANGAQARETLGSLRDLGRWPKLAAMHALAGQVSEFAPAPPGHDPSVVLSGSGYWLPSVEGRCVGGSTYLHGAAVAEVTRQGRATIADKVSALLGLDVATVLGWAGGGRGWAGWRAVVPGRLPVIGPVPDASGLWLACAYGSRGLTWSALAGDIIAAALHHEPQVLERDLTQAIALR